MNGPDTSEDATRIAKCALEHAARLTLIALTSFVNHHVPVNGRPAPHRAAARAARGDAPAAAGPMAGFPAHLKGAEVVIARHPHPERRPGHDPRHA
jgi:hypothetical protein